jgi:hypothetical protein
MSILEGIGASLSGASLWDKLIPIGISTLGQLFAGGGDKRGSDSLSFDERMKLQEAELANRLAIAQLQAASAGAGSGAALAAARITDARERQRIKIEAQQALLSGRMRMLEMMKPDTLTSAINTGAQLAQRGGESAQTGYQNLAGLIGRGMVSAQQPIVGR